MAAISLVEEGGMVDIIKPFFDNGVPKSLEDAKAFFDRYEEASPLELSGLSKEFEFVSSQDICLVDEFLFSSSRTDGRLTTLICEGLPPIHDLDEQALGYLLYESYKCFASGKYDQGSFEKNMVKVINGYWPDHPTPLLRRMGSYISSGNLVLPKGVSQERILVVGEGLDKSLADQLHLSRRAECDYVNDAGDISYSLSKALLPISLAAVIESLDGNHLLAMDLFQRLVRWDSINTEYLSVFERTNGRDFVLSAIRSISYSVSPFSMTAISDIYGESSLFNDGDFSGFGESLDRKILPSSFIPLISNKIDQSRFPVLTDYVKSNFDKVYRCQVKSETKLRLVEFAVRNGLGIDVLSIEVEMARLTVNRDYLPIIEDLGVSRTLDAISVKYHSSGGVEAQSEYLSIIDILLRIEIQNAHEVLRSVDGRLITDIMDNYLDSVDHDFKKRIMKMYPQTKSFVLESDLGL